MKKAHQGLKAVFEARGGCELFEFSNKEDAKRAVEAHGSGSVVSVYDGRTGRLEAYRDGVWRGIDISR